MKNLIITLGVVILMALLNDFQLYTIGLMR
jgi:hypothetical protein